MTDWAGSQSGNQLPVEKLPDSYLPWAALKLLCLVGAEILLLLTAVRKGTAVFTAHTEWGLSPVHSKTLRSSYSG